MFLFVVTAVNGAIIAIGRGGSVHEYAKGGRSQR